MSTINFLNPEQEVLIPEYQEKWKRIAFSTESIDHNLAQDSVKELCKIMGKAEPEIIFCASPFEALERLQTYVDQVEIPLYNNIKSEEDLRRNFWSVFARQGWEVFKMWNKQKKSAKIPIYELVTKLTNEALKSFSQQVDVSIPEDLTTEQIVEESFFNSLPLFQHLKTENLPQGYPEFSQIFETASKEEWQESFRQTATAIETQLSWLPFKEKLFQGWFKQFLKGSLSGNISGVTGVDYPRFKEIIYVNLSPYQQKFLLENPPLIMPEIAITCIWLDFAFSVLNYSHNTKQWHALQNLVQQCGSIFTMGNFYLICDRPTKILLNENNQFHGENESALEFADGTAIYAYNGVYLPEKYNQVKPNQWQSQWVLDEKNKQLQLVLMEGIGALRLSQELPFEQVDVMGEYTLLKLENVGRIRTHILKRIDSKMGEIKAEFIPWNKRSLVKAVEYAHKYISAEDFPLINNPDI